MTDLSTALDEIEARADAATPGPWITTHGERSIHRAAYARRDLAAVHTTDETWIAHYVDPADAAFIAAARSDVPRLVAALRAGLAVDPRAVDPTETPDFTDPIDYARGWNDAVARMHRALTSALTGEVGSRGE